MGIERDEFYVGERVVFDADLTVTDDPAAALDPLTTVLTVQQPDATDATPALTITGVPARHVRAEYLTAQDGWHEWRLASTGTVEAVRQGRFRVVPVNV